MAEAPPNPVRVGFLGAGQMAGALARGWLDAGLITSDSRASDPYPEACERFTTATGLGATSDNLEVVRGCDTLVLAVKPQVLGRLLADIAPAVGRAHLLVSIAAGVTIGRITRSLGSERRVVRVMPNTPCLVGEGAAGVSAGPGATAEDAELVRRMFAAVGVAFVVPEKLLDAVTGLSGSGPAFVYQVIEALSDGGVLSGLPRDVATALAAQTVLGAAAMVLRTGKHPGELKDMVTSPAGTTIAGLHELERGGLRAALMDAVQAATLRAEELGS